MQWLLLLFPFYAHQSQSHDTKLHGEGAASIERWQSFTTELAKVLVYQNMTRCLCLPS